MRSPGRVDNQPASSLRIGGEQPVIEFVVSADSLLSGPEKTTRPVQRM